MAAMRQVRRFMNNNSPGHGPSSHGCEIGEARSACSGQMRRAETSVRVRLEVSHASFSISDGHCRSAIRLYCRRAAGGGVMQSWLCAATSSNEVPICGENLVYIGRGYRLWRCVRTGAIPHGNQHSADRKIEIARKFALAI